MATLIECDEDMRMPFFCSLSVGRSTSMSVASPSAGISSDDRASENNSPARDLDLPALGAALWRKRWQVLIPTLLTALSAFIAVQVITPKYFSEARILIESRSNVYLRPDADKI